MSAPGGTDAAHVLGRIPLFSDLSPSELQEIAWLVSPFELEAGGLLFRQGDPGDALYCVEHGRIALTVRMPGGGQVPLSEVGPGEVLGEMALLDAGPRSATAIASEPTGGYALSALGFDVLRAALRPSGFKVLRRLATALTTRLRVHAQGFATGDPVRVDGTVGPPAHGTHDPLAGLRAPARSLDRHNLVLLHPFRRFSPDELDALLEVANALVVPRRHVVFREGDPAGSCFVIVRGAVLVCVPRGGEHRKLAVEGPGAVFGHFALLAPGTRSATCVTRESSVLLEIDRATFDGMFDSTSAAAFKFFAAVTELLCGELRRTNRRVGLAAHPS